MIMGPLAGYAIRRFDRMVEGRVKAGFEMLVSNFSIGILGMLLAVLGYYVVGSVVSGLTMLISSGAELVIRHGLLPLVSLFVEPAKVLFLNNAVNHGIFSPIGIEQARETGQSIMFLLETNPGPGLGVLLAYWLFGRGNARQSAPGAVIIQFFGGIHEIYFPYILARPVLIVAAIAGSAAGLLFFSLTDAGLVAPASPGSILSVLAMAPKGKTLIVLAGRRDLRSRVAARRRTLYPTCVQDRNGRRSSRREAPAERSGHIAACSRTTRPQSDLRLRRGHGIERPRARPVSADVSGTRESALRWATVRRTVFRPMPTWSYASPYWRSGSPRPQKAPS